MISTPVLKGPWVLFMALALTSCTQAEQSGELPVTAVTKQDLVQKVTLAGTIEPLRSTSVIAPFDGYVKKLFVSIGDQIERNAPLVAVSENLTDSGPFFPIRAPFAGRVVQVNMKEGEYVKAQDAQMPILRVDDWAGFVVKAKVPEVDILKIKKDQEVIIKASAILNKQYKGSVEELALASEVQERYARTQSTQFPITIKISDADESIRAGMSVIADVVSQTVKDALVLPHAFVSSDREGHFVTLESGKVLRIQVGAQNEMHTQVIGLKEGDQVRQVNFYTTEGSN